LSRCALMLAGKAPWICRISPDGAENNNTRQEDHPLWIEVRR
jgi:hypothetical protein